ncbi:MAG TPA: tyrosine--tRNA ligase [Gemmatimonadaceae bacterium]|nr:tyrosine--tRNA ligase [Gemmatimonadaceae bacterium]
MPEPTSTPSTTAANTDAAGGAPHPLLADLSWRGALYQHTEGLSAFLSGRDDVRGYCGFDPTASSLHVGSLLPVMGLMRLQQFGVRPVALVGGGTGMIGDPSGRASERTLITADEVAANTAALRTQLERFLDFGGPRAAEMRDNLSWLRPLGAIDFMRDVGKHFTVNYMLAKDSVKSRLEAGISFTEFSYMLLQAYDFLELYRRDGVALQVGGSDQWGNMTAGMELIRRTVGGEAHVLTFPLLTKADGTKFGKSEGGNVWLDAELTSPYAFYQFWVNADDRDVGRLLRLFTLLPREEIETLDAATSARPEAREAQHALARDVTARVHGAEQMRAAVEVSTLLFGGGDPRQLSTAALALLRREVRFTRLAPAVGLTDGNGAPALADVLDLLTATGLAASRGAAKRLVEQGGVYVNGERRSMGERFVREEDLLRGRHVLLRKGARDYALVEIAPA